jgi:Tfp pilus assembly protein PilF
MRRLCFALLLLVAVVAGAVGAQSPEDTYYRIYSLIQDGDAAQTGNDIERALNRYTEAQTALQRLQTVAPNWSTNVVAFRLRYLSQRIEQLRQIAPPKVTPFTPPSVKPQATPAADPQLARIGVLQQQIQSLQQDNAVLNAKLREALAVQPPATDPRELARAQEQLRESAREIELLRASLDAEKARPKTDNAELDKLKNSLAEANRQLAEQSQLAENWTREKTLLQDHVRELLTDSQALAALRAENELLKRQAAEVNAQGASAEKLQELSKLLQQSQAQVATLEADQAAYRAEKALLEKRVAELQAGSTNESTRVALLEQERGALILERDTARSQLTDAVSELASVRAQMPASKPTDSGREAFLERELRAMQLERDALDRRLSSSGSRSSQQLQAERDMLRTELASARSELAGQQTRADQNAASAKKLESERDAARKQKDTLQLQLEAALADLQKERDRPAASKPDKDLIRDLEVERDFLKDQLARALKAPTNATGISSAERINSLADELAGLRARLDAYEAKAVPYTAQELALFQARPPGVENSDLTASLTMQLPPGNSSDTSARLSRVAPANARDLIAEGQRAFGARQYAEAEQRYLDALKLDAQSVFVLANLGAIELEMNKLPDAEQHLQTAVALDPDDAFSLTVLGYLRHQQQRLDDALSLLSRAAKADPKRADTQNYLGVALSQKGLRGPAEAALRRAINLDPAYGSAHANLAVVYIAQKPPMVELSRWHYEKALAAGQPRDPNLEKMLVANGVKLDQ